jgi:hypothetical protein
MSLPAEPHTGGRHSYDGVLPDASKGLLVTLLAPHKWDVALGMIPDIWALVDLSPVSSPQLLPSP